MQNGNFTNVKTEFFICADKLDFLKVSELLSIEPTKITPKTDIKIKEYAKDCWSFDIEYQNLDCISKQLDMIYEIFHNKIDVLNDIARMCDASIGINIVINVYDNILPEMVIEPRLMKFMGDINAQLAFDMYYF